MAEGASGYKNLIDIHCHVLPGIDDGPSDWQQSLEMARAAVDHGISTIISTPHWIKGTSWQPSADTVLNKISELTELLSKEKIDLHILPGMEIGIIENLAELIKSGQVLTLAGSSYVLIEIPYISLPFGLEEIIFEIVSAGYMPVLAHPERNKELHAEPERILDLIDRGALAQITTGSLCGDWGDGAKNCSEQFAKMEAIFSVASDGHSAVSRPPDMQSGLKALENLVGKQKVAKILSNSEKIIRKS
ncbi:MAG: tyrosine protein phosphatase [Candidatus Dadabacteria bacterium]|nr:tyrosine protein phosphatase [Candidatus Dadabacteria bacterium]NIS09151.1 tyrosine protein phosphatase [Candidatus Dadabacteria bacterium]NIY22458.1 tyrosine protein phosphatase [Candidatus Dadabacteria bacterium]